MKKLLVLCLAFLLLACVPTPDREAIVNRADGSMEQALSAPRAEAYRYDAPPHWTETISMKNLEIRIDAEIDLNDTDVHPVQTIKRHAFTCEDVMNLLNAAFSGPFELRENRYSISEIEEDIRMEMRGNVIDWDDETGEVTWEPLTEETEALTELKVKMAQCPAADSFVPLKPELLQPDSEVYVIRTGDGKLLYLHFQSDAISIMPFRSGDLQNETLVWQGGYIGEPWHHTIDHIVVSEAEAARAGKAFLDRADLSDQFGVGLLEKGRMIRPIVEEPYHKVLSEGYILHVARTGGGYVPFPQGGGMFNDDRLSAAAGQITEETFSQIWQPDWMEVYVTENGIEGVRWYDPNEFVMNANENVQLMPFDAVQTHIRDDLHFCYAWSDEGNRGVSELHVKRIVLSCAIARLKNSPDEAVLVPTWIVVYNNNRAEKVHGIDSLMLINAIDGSMLHAY